MDPNSFPNNNIEYSSQPTNIETAEFPSFEEHMENLNSGENAETTAETVLETATEHSAEKESTLANNPWSPYLSYETNLKENNERLGETFAKLNESVYEEYDKAHEESVHSMGECVKYDSIFSMYGIDKKSGTRHYYVPDSENGTRREYVTPLRIDAKINSEGKSEITNKEEFEPEALAFYEDLSAKRMEAHVKNYEDEIREREALIELNILNNGFANHGMENSAIVMREDSVPGLTYQEKTKSELAIDGDEAVIPPNPNGELSLPEYIDSVAEYYDDMANEASAELREFKSKYEKAWENAHSKNPIKSLLGWRKYNKMRGQYNQLVQKTSVISSYRNAAFNLQWRLENQDNN